MIMIRFLVVVAVASLAVAPKVGAQSPSSSASPLCWTAKPLPDCGAWIVSEFGVEKGVVSSRRFGGDMDFSHAFSITLGRMTNSAPTKARGFTGAIYLGTGLGFRAEMRRRTWTSAVSATDWSVGLASQAMGAGTSDFGLGLTGGAALNYRWLAMTGRADLMQWERGTAAGLSVGARIGEKAGTAGAGIFIAAVGTLIFFLVGAADD
jgi:hypothetical protein